LAPDLFAAQQRAQEALLLLRRAVGDDRRPGHADAHGERADVDAERRLLLGEDRRFGAGAATTAVLDGPRDARPAVVGEHRLPRLRVLEVATIAITGRGGRRRVRVQPRSDLRAEPDPLRRLVETQPT